MISFLKPGHGFRLTPNLIIDRPVMHPSNGTLSITQDDVPTALRPYATLALRQLLHLLTPEDVAHSLIHACNTGWCNRAPNYRPALPLLLERLQFFYRPTEHAPAALLSDPDLVPCAPVSREIEAQGTDQMYRAGSPTGEWFSEHLRQGDVTPTDREYPQRSEQYPFDLSEWRRTRDLLGDQDAEFEDAMEAIMYHRRVAVIGDPDESAKVHGGTD
jgi:hypothetical protein